MWGFRSPKHKDESSAPAPAHDSSVSDSTKIIDSIPKSIIGAYDLMTGPFGDRKITYCDYTASGRAVSWIEDFVASEILPLYANTHTTSSYTGLRISLLREEARETIARAVNATKDDQVLFVGSGVTGAINLLCNILKTQLKPPSRSVVFLGPYEHHSNMLPWRESGAKIVNIREDFTGKTMLDLDHLKEELENHRDYDLKIGSFSAASNVSGIKTPMDPVTVLLHEYGALSFWDCASFAPYCRVDMNPASGPGKFPAVMLAKDAAFISPHKFLGGPGAVGILVVKKNILTDSMTCFTCESAFVRSGPSPPASPGGGTVRFVTLEKHRYLDDLKEREEGGTPNIVGCIRAGLSFQFQESIGYEKIESLETSLAEQIFTRLTKIPYMYILGNPKVRFAHRLPIISFLIKHNNTFLHHNFVCTLLNDLFGIQSRGGCACAGPYGALVLGIEYSMLDEFERAVVDENVEILKPGFSRINFSYFYSKEEIEYVCSALEFIAENGWKFLPYYSFQLGKTEWKHRSYSPKPSEGRCLADLSLKDGKPSWSSKRKVLKLDADLSSLYDSYLKEAKEALKGIQSLRPVMHRKDFDQSSPFPEALAHLRWFTLPAEAIAELQDGAADPALMSRPSIFQPYRYYLRERSEKPDLELSKSEKGSKIALSPEEKYDKAGSLPKEKYIKSVFEEKPLFEDMCDDPTMKEIHDDDEPRSKRSRRRFS